MMSKPNFREFHIPFIKSLAIVGLVTIVSMISARYFIENVFANPYKSHEYTIQESQKNPD